MQWKWKAWLHTPHATVHSSLVADAWFAWHSMPAGQHTVTVYMYSTVSCTCIWPTHCHCIHVQYSQLYMYMANTLSLYTCTVQSAVHVYGQHTVTIHMYSTVSCTCIWPTHCHCSTVSCTCIWPTHCHCIHVQYSQLYMYMANTLSLYTCTVQSAVHVYGQHTVTVVQSAVHVYGQHTVTVYMYSTVSCTCIWPTHCHCTHVHVQYSQLYMHVYGQHTVTVHV